MLKSIKEINQKSSNVKYDFSHLFENMESTNKEINKIVTQYENKHMQVINKILNEDRKIKGDNMAKDNKKLQIKDKYSDLYNACSKYPKIVLHTKLVTRARFDTASPEQLVDTIAEDGFIENFCLSEEKSEQVKQLRKIRKNNRTK